MTVQVVHTQIDGLIVTDVAHQSGCGLHLGRDIFEATCLPPFARVQIQNLSTGQHWETCVVADHCLGNVSLQGADARLAEPGDRLVVLLFGHVDEVGADYLPTFISL